MIGPGNACDLVDTLSDTIRLIDTLIARDVPPLVNLDPLVGLRAEAVAQIEMLTELLEPYSQIERYKPDPTFGPS